MAVLGKPQGIFDLSNSDQFVGSFITKDDIKTILNVKESDLVALKFETIDNLYVIDERNLQKAWYKGEIKNASPVNNSSLEELFLISIIRNSLPNCIIERQIQVNRFKMDLKLTHNSKSLFIEFDGPSHFSISKYGIPKHEPFRKKKIVQDKTGIEVANWAYWIQRCTSNVKALFDENVKGLGVLWSTNVHFGDFYFENSADIIEAINKRFNVEHDGGSGYFYGANTLGRNNPEHPIIEAILSGKESIHRLLPKGFQEKSQWLPKKLQNL